MPLRVRHERSPRADGGRRASLWLLLSLFVMSSAGIAVAAPSELRRGNGPEVESLDPHRVQGVSASNILRDLYEGLVSESPDGSLVPGAASHWEISANQLRYVFHLRPEARWSNGDPVTAADFVAGMRRSIDPATGSQYSQILAPIAGAASIIAGASSPESLGVTALAPLQLEIRLRAPTPYFLGLLTHAATYPIHTPSLAQHADRSARPGRLVGNGAYRLVERVMQSHVLLERNPHYWDDRNTAITRVKYVVTEDIDSEFKRFRAGELDWTSQVPASQIKWSRDHLPDALAVHGYLGVYYYGFNLLHPPFKDNPKLRRALSLAIDRRVIADKVLGAGELPADGWIPPGIPGYAPAKAQWAGWTREQCLAEARRLYAEAGYSPDRPAQVEIRYNTHEDHKKVATAVAAMWKQWLGVETTLINEEWKVYLQNRRMKAKTQVYRAGWIGDYNDANTFLEILHSAHGLNDTGYASPEYDALVERAGMEADAQRRADLLSLAEARLLEDLPVIPIYFYVTKRLVSPRLVGWQGNVMDHHASRHLRFRDSPGVESSSPR